MREVVNMNRDREITLHDQTRVSNPICLRGELIGLCAKVIQLFKVIQGKQSGCLNLRDYVYAIKIKLK